MTNSKVTTSRARKVIGHSVCWMILISYELGIIYNVSGHLEPAYVYATYYGINILFFYGQVELFNAVFYRKTCSYVKAAAIFVSWIALNLFFKYVADHLLSDQHIVKSTPVIFLRGFVARNIVRTSYFSMLATFYWISGYVNYAKGKRLDAERKQLSAQKESAELEILLEKSRNAYLQQQINPHMLFNALNFVYNTVQKHSADAAQCIWLLSEIMRFSLEGTGTDGKILLVKELEQIENLVAVNRYRFKEPLCLTTEIDEDADNLRIIPLILLTLMENVFKHGDLTDEACPALLQIKLQANGQLTFFSRNLKKSKNTQPKMQELGLQNVQIRLNSAYPGNYHLTIDEPGDLYELTLSLNLCA